MIACAGVDDQERVRAALKRGARDKPGVEYRPIRLGLGPAVDQVQAGPVTAQCAAEALENVRVARSRSLRYDDLPVADTEVGQLEAIGIERTFARSYGRVVVCPNPADDVDRTARAQQVRKRRQPVAGQVVRRDQGDDAWYENACQSKDANHESWMVGL